MTDRKWWGIRATWAEYRFQRTKGHGIRTALYRAFHYQPPHPGFRWTPAELAEELTGYLWRGGERKLLVCHPSVASAVRDLIPPEPAWPLGLNPSISPGPAIAMLTGIDLIIKDEYGEGEWRLIRARDNSMIIFGTLP
jgi:hypothetical protein